jgi:branched-chain amino acid transport system substrate-binding protein
MVRGQTLAIEEINARGGLLGHKLALSTLDTKDQSADVMRNVFRRFVSQGVAAVFAGYTTYDSVEYPILGEAGIPTYHMNTWHGNLEFVKAHNYLNIFETCPPELWYGPGFVLVVDKLINSGAWKPSSKTVAIVTSNDPYSLAIAQAVKTGLEAKGWTTTMFSEFTVPQADWNSVLVKIRQTPPGIIFFSDYDPGDEASFIKQFRLSPTRSLVYQQYAPSVPQYLDLAGSAADGVIWSTMIGTITSDSFGQDFIARYTKRFGERPGLSLAGGYYDVVRIWARAVEAAGDPYNFKAVSAATANQIFRGVSGSFSFLPGFLNVPPYPDQVSDPSIGMPHLSFQIQGGKQALISPDPYATGQFQLPAWLK